MRPAVIIAVAVSLLMAAGGPVLGRWLPPATATRHPEVAARLALPATGGDVPARVRALLAPPPRRRPASVAALAALLAVLTAATVTVQQRGEQLFEYAQRHAATTSHLGRH